MFDLFLKACNPLDVVPDTQLVPVLQWSLPWTWPSVTQTRNRLSADARACAARVASKRHKLFRKFLGS